MAQQIEEPKEQVEFVMKEETVPSQQIMSPPPQRQVPIYQQMAMERRLANLQKIDRLKQFIVLIFSLTIL